MEWSPTDEPERVPGVPDRLASDLRRLHPETGTPEGGLERLVAHPRRDDTAWPTAENGGAGRRSRRWLGIAAALLPVAIVGLLVLRPSAPGPQTVRSAWDTNGDGATDILDALALHRALLPGGTGGAPSPDADLNRDGRTDGADVDAIASLVVRLDGSAG